MNKTRTIMAAIAASLLMGSTASNSASTVTPQQDKKPIADGCKRGCPNFDEKGAQRILDWLNAQPSSTAEYGKTVNEIVSHAEQLSVEQATQILDCLWLNSCISRSGTGTKESPYKYAANGGRG
jgi:hypothetical protein